MPPEAFLTGPMSVAGSLEHWISGGGTRIGQIQITKSGAESFELRHWEDPAGASLEMFDGATAARQIGRNDDSGKYRPLKSAPNLRHGWMLRVEGMKALRLALDFFYPAALGIWAAHERSRVEPVCFRRTAERQSGMYEIVKRVTNEEANALAGEFCTSAGRCLKTILWEVSEGVPITTLPPEKFLYGGTESDTMPLLCTEACNLFVAAAREVAKKSRAKS